MAIITTDDRHYQNIAGQLRQYTGENETYTPAQMCEEIRNVHEKGYQAGWNDGYGVGHVDGFASGEESYRQQFWDFYQDGGNRTDYSFAFAGAGWTEEIFWPRHDLVITNGYQAFAYFGFAGSLKDRLNACGVRLLFEGNPVLMNLFTNADKITELGEIDFSTLSSNESNMYIFSQCTALRTIEKLIVPQGQTNWAGWFSGCSALENIRIGGAIIHGGLSFADSPKLTRESMLSVIHALTDRSGTSGTNSIVFGSVNLAKLTESDKTIATAKGWTLA